ncbi:hypothetical protein [Dyella flagellata]|uniref:Uncharacterized protein n=1 Tax=Dyella flagellata TaxID=1867833 RepID=A0ABQ5XHG1_9GAMM|nr:hypothetical protein [Dyella flagellata]GLQ89914.1 hypothetical protein GCM10007898_34890 [Dyella flagellata]
MSIEIGEVSSTVHTVDSDLPLSAKAMQRLVQHVAHAVRDGEAHRKRCEDERKVTAGVVAERDEESRGD